jgi:hypothetical protein
MIKINTWKKHSIIPGTDRTPSPPQTLDPAKTEQKTKVQFET